MPEEVIKPISGQSVALATGAPQPTAGTGGLDTKLPGTATTVSQIGNAGGGIGLGNFVQPDIDQELAQFESDRTPLMALMLNAKKVPVNSPVVMHFMNDEARSILHTSSEVAENTGSERFILPIEQDDRKMITPHTTLLVLDVDGYTSEGNKKEAGKPLMLFCIGTDTTSGNPIVTPVNGPRTRPQSELCTTPAIPSGSKVLIMGNALTETQKEVAPDTNVPVHEEVYLQKRGMTTIVSDYFDRQNKVIPYTQALIAEQSIREFKRKSNLSLLVGRKGKIKAKINEKIGVENIYTTEGVRWQVKRELNKSKGAWKFLELIALAKLYYTGADVPSSGIMLCGKNVLEQLQSIDFSKYGRDVTIESHTNELGWPVTRINTIFGAIDLKREPAFDQAALENSAIIIDPKRLVHYVYRAETHLEGEVEGHEVSVDSTIVWDALVLKGISAVWINGEGEIASSSSTTTYTIWDSASAPTSGDLVVGAIYCLIVDCPGIHENAKAGQSWLWNGSKWSEFDGVING